MKTLLATGAALTLAAGLATADEETATFRDCAACPEMVVVPAGSFRMGASPAPAGETVGTQAANQFPVREVAIAKPFAIGRFEVTQAEWEALMGMNPSAHKAPDQPVERVSRPHVFEYLRRLSEATGRSYRLPSEAEWEYAARAGEITAFPADRDAVAFYDSLAAGGPRPVGQSEPNAFGLHDMLGNVWEWVADCYRPTYAEAPTDGTPLTAAATCIRSLRGGGWASDGTATTFAFRLPDGPPDMYAPTPDRADALGFRVAVSLD